MKAAKAWAVIMNRDFVTPEDIHEVIVPVLSHRILLTPEKEMEGATPVDIIQQILESTDIPR
jgi:MoxR-like ATPase